MCLVGTTAATVARTCKGHVELYSGDTILAPGSLVVVLCALLMIHVRY